ncbi:MAG TPA: RNA 2',3'-cyclic phosphodiesterase [Candidatus Sulfotelmatobacter sp.]|nr:RNA 2',3'-cyclic phosphodiesterase [Candidatus Sulfotelmatobacter sp.]
MDPRSAFLRLFIAIPLPETVRAELLRFQNKLQPLLPPRDVRWTKPEQFHLTLKFLGNVPAANTAALSCAVCAVCDNAAPMRLCAEGVGFFPDARSPRVFWVDIKSVDGLLMDFQRRLELSVRPFAEKEEANKFTAHVTLARFEKLRHRDTDKLAAAAAIGKTFGEWTAEEVQLIKSSLQPSGALHVILERFTTKMTGR